LASIAVDFQEEEVTVAGPVGIRFAEHIGGTARCRRDIPRLLVAVPTPGPLPDNGTVGQVNLHEQNISAVRRGVAVTGGTGGDQVVLTCWYDSEQSTAVGATEDSKPGCCFALRGDGRRDRAG